MDRRTPAAASGYWLVIAALVLIAIGLRLALYDPYAQYHADEFYQYLEQGHRLATGQGLVPWEGRLGIRNGLIPQFLALPMSLGELIAPHGILPVHLARLSFMALCLAALAGAWGIGAARSRQDAVAALLVASLWYESAFFGTTLLSESAATALLTCGAALLLVERAKVRTLRLAGFLLVLGVLVRLQYAPFVLVLAALSLRKNPRMWQPLAFGAVAALALGGISDVAYGQVPFAWAIGTLRANIGEGMAARYGVEGPLFYVQAMLEGLGPAAVPIFVASIFAGKRYWPLIIANLANIAVHTLIAHKEVRFVWLSLFLTLVLAAIATVKAVGWIAARRGAGPIRARLGLIAVLAAWVGLALLSWRGGETRLPRTGGVYALAANQVAKQPAICGLAVPEDWRNHVVAAYLGRNVPLYVMPVELLGGLSPLPDELARGANAVLEEGDLLSNPEYAVKSCHERDGQKACLLVREGGCEPAMGQAYGAQAWMNAKKL